MRGGNGDSEYEETLAPVTRWLGIVLEREEAVGYRAGARFGAVLVLNMLHFKSRMRGRLVVITEGLTHLRAKVLSVQFHSTNIISHHFPSLQQLSFIQACNISCIPAVSRNLHTIQAYIISVIQCILNHSPQIYFGFSRIFRLRDARKY